MDAMLSQGKRRRNMAGPGVFEVNDATFEQEVLQADEPVLVDFWAAWCGPCRALNPTIEALARDYKVCKVNLDTNPDLAAHYRVEAVPTLLLFKGGQLVRRHVGGRSEMELRT